MLHPLVAQQIAVARLATMIEAAEHHRRIAALLATTPRPEPAHGIAHRWLTRIIHPQSRAATTSCGACPAPTR